MYFISRFLNKKISSLISKFNVPTKVAEQFENDYPIEGMGDHHRFLLKEIAVGSRIEQESESDLRFISVGTTGL